MFGSGPQDRSGGRSHGSAGLPWRKREEEEPRIGGPAKENKDGLLTAHQKTNDELLGKLPNDDEGVVEDAIIPKKLNHGATWEGAITSSGRPDEISAVGGRTSATCDDEEEGWMDGWNEGKKGREGGKEGVRG